MPHPKSLDIPPPEHEQEFEVLCRDLLVARKRPVVDPNLYGRRGQAQHGIDILLQLDDGLHGYQCKRVVRLTIAEVEEELRKTSGFPLPLRCFTVLTTADNDARLLDEVHALSLARVAAGLSPVAIVFWTTLRDWLVEYTAVLRAHYPVLAGDGQVPRGSSGDLHLFTSDAPLDLRDVHLATGSTINAPSGELRIMTGRGPLSLVGVTARTGDVVMTGALPILRDPVVERADRVTDAMRRHGMARAHDQVHRNGVLVFRACDWPPSPWADPDGYYEIAVVASPGPETFEASGATALDRISAPSDIIELYYLFGTQGYCENLRPFRAVRGKVVSIGGEPYERPIGIYPGRDEVIVVRNGKYHLQLVKCIDG